MASATRNATVANGNSQWADADNAKAAGGGYAYHTSVSTSSATIELLLTAFGFSADIPTCSTIDGIEVSIARKGDTGEGIWVYDSSVNLWLSGSPTGTNKADTSTHWPDIAGAFGTAVYGGATDTWGYTRTRADVCDATFGVALTCRAQGASGLGADVDHIAMTVYYTAPTTRRRREPQIIGG